jgi:hypothetical protein
VAEALTAQNLVVDDSNWSGKARDAYVPAASAQAAATRVGSISDKTMNVLLTTTAAGLAFYLALALVLVKLITTSITAIAALGSAVFSWVGATITLEEAGVNTAIVVTALVALITCLGAQANAMINLHAEAVNPATFPDGHWPNPHTTTYNDSTISNGGTGWSSNPADSQLRRQADTHYRRQIRASDLRSASPGLLPAGLGEPAPSGRG